MSSYQYRVYGLRVDSEIKIPELNPDSEGPPDAYIQLGEVPTELQDYKYKGVFYQAKKDDFIFNMDQVGSFRVKKGRDITLNPMSGANIELMRVFLMGSVFGAMLHQKGILALHGSAVACNGEALVITGRSSSGKSTLAAALANEGYPFITDDISALHRQEGIHYVHPGIPHMKLWKDVINQLGLEDGLSKVRPSVEKYRKPVNQGFSQHPEKVSTIVKLGIKNTKGIEIRELSGIEKFEALRENTYRYKFIDALQQSDQHFRSISELANTVKVFLVQRPTSPLMIEELTKEVIEKIISPGK